MLTNSGHISFNYMGVPLLLPTKFDINESSMAKILYFAEVSNNEGVHIKMDTSKENIINVYIEDVKTVHLKSCA